MTIRPGGDGRSDRYESERQRTIVLTFDSPVAAKTWDSQDDQTAMAIAGAIESATHTGDCFTQSLAPRSTHPMNSCPACGDAVSSVGITKLAYVFAECKCGTPTYDHLVETLYHRTCLERWVCPVYRSWQKGGYPRSTHTDCMVCGRAEASHEVTP